MPRRVLLMAALAAVTAAGASSPARWGYRGHEMGARAAHALLPDEMPRFFLDARETLAWLDVEPDRWRGRDHPELDAAGAYDHYIDLENVPPEALEAPDRFAYLRLLYEAGLARPERDAGFLPWRIIELHQRLVEAWRAWYDPANAEVREAVEVRILNDAGILGHYVLDASQPHHTTIHFNGWDADAPNPEGFTYDRSFHSRFERFFVDAHLRPEDLSPRLAGPLEAVRVGDGLRTAVHTLIAESHAQVGALYRLDRDVGFDPDAPADPRARDFAADRLAHGSEVLATLWWSAWLEGRARD